LFKSNPPCTAVACQPTPAPTAAPSKPTPPPTTVVKAATEPPQPRDWRESWGKIEPWKGTTQTNAAKPTDTPKSTDTTTTSKPVARKPAPLDLPKQPDPLKNPDWYGEMALKKKPVNSKIPDEALKSAPAPDKNVAAQNTPKPLPVPVPDKNVVAQNTPKPLPPLPPPQTTAPTPAVQPTPPAPAAEEYITVSPTQPHGRVVQVPADDPNAFEPSAPPPPRPGAQQQPKLNAFDRDDGSPPPRSGMPMMAGVPQGPMPMGAPLMGAMPMPMPPMPPMPPRPPMPPPMVDSGVPSGMANAFTLTATRRPIPADFGGTPQEPNGFGNAEPQMEGPGSPPQAYVVPRSGMMQPPYPGMQNSPRPPMAVNPLMGVPQGAVASGRPMTPVEPPAGVPQLLATLKDSLYPSQREGAADKLSELNWRMQPQVVESLTKSARDDPAATVRAACVRALGHMKVDTHEVVVLMQDLKSDRDSRVRQQVDETLNLLGPAARQDSGVRQVSDK
jgi:hypothetical protein